MSNYNRKEQLEKIHEIRKANTALKVDGAIKRLLKANESINFNSMSKEAGIAKATLYNNEDFRSRIEKLRNQQSQVPTPKQVKREIMKTTRMPLLNP